jgi:hypothetical protein
MSLKNVSVLPNHPAPQLCQYMIKRYKEFSLSAWYCNAHYSGTGSTQVSNYFLSYNSRVEFGPLSTRNKIRVITDQILASSLRRSRACFVASNLRTATLGVVICYTDVCKIMSDCIWTLTISSITPLASTFFHLPALLRSHPAPQASAQ